VGDVNLGKYANPTKSLRKPYSLEKLCLGDGHPMELIMPILNKVTKSGMLSLDISLKGVIVPLEWTTKVACTSSRLWEEEG